MTEQDKACMRRAIERSAMTSWVDTAGGVFGTVMVDTHGHVRPSPVRSFRWLLNVSSSSAILPFLAFR